MWLKIVKIKVSKTELPWVYFSEKMRNFQSVCNNESFKCFFSKIIPYGPVTKFRNLSDVHSILLGAVENDFQLVIQKETYEIANDL